MHFKFALLGSLLGLTAVTKAHFVLQIPTNIGFDDDLEDQAPCGSFSPTDRSSGVTDWPTDGSSIALLTTHTQQIWHISAALLSDVTNFVPLIPDISQAGVGTFCLPQVPGISAWVGQDAVLQVIQNSVDGTLYQCAAIRFVTGGPASVPSGCINSTGISASYNAESSPSSSSSQPTSTTGTESSSTTAPSPTGEPTTSSATSSETPSETSSATSPEASSTSVANSTTTQSTTATPAAFTGASNNLQAGNFMLSVGGIAALIAWGL
ncbi:MAG: hypothetical protein M1839_005026 [Geoglossum umbratile]|nr:MAG: hypothetical protein M1839_005026 [Geoglossum umbratile]